MLEGEGRLRTSVGLRAFAYWGTRYRMNPGGLGKRADESNLTRRYHPSGRSAHFTESRDNRFRRWCRQARPRYPTVGAAAKQELPPWRKRLGSGGRPRFMLPAGVGGGRDRRWVFSSAAPDSYILRLRNPRRCDQGSEATPDRQRAKLAGSFFLSYFLFFLTFLGISTCLFLKMPVKSSYFRMRVTQVP
jgi:hypothetical protein